MSPTRPITPRASAPVAAPVRGRGEALPGARVVVPGGLAPGGRWILLAALALAATRFLKLGAWSLWHDEALALSDSLELPGVVNPIGYLLYRLVFSGGDVRPSELALRMPAAILGALGVPLCYALFRRFVPDRHAAGAALLVAVSHWHVYWSQNARFYTLALDLSLVGATLVLGGLVLGRARRVGLGLLVLVLAATTHPSATFLLGGVLIGPWIARGFGLGSRDHDGRAWTLLLVAGVGLVLCGAPWAWNVWDTWIEKKAANPTHFVFTTGFYVTPIVGAAAVLGTLLVFRRRAPFECLAAVSLGTALTVALGAAIFARMSAQYVFWSLPWIALLAAAPLGAERRRGFISVPRGFANGFLALCVLPLLANLGLYFTVAHGDRPRWRDAYAYVCERAQPGDLILGMEASVGEYYLSPDPARTELRRWREVAYLDTFRADLPAQWSRWPRRTWLVLNREQLEDWSRRSRETFLVALRREFHLQETFAVEVLARDLDVLVYLRE